MEINSESFNDSKGFNISLSIFSSALVDITSVGVSIIPSLSVSMTANTAPTSTTSPSLNKISFSIPELEKEPQSQLYL